MLKYSLRIFREDLLKWIPGVAVTAAVTCLVGIMVSEYVFLHQPPRGHPLTLTDRERNELEILSQTLYIVVALLAAFSLTAVGSATVGATRHTFGMWRLVGAGPACVRRCATGVVAITAATGALVGGVVSVAVSYLVIPLLIRMVVPTAVVSYQGSFGAFLGAILLGFLPCMCGAIEPIRRAGRVEPLEALRRRDEPGSRYLLRVISGSFFLLIGLTLMVGSCIFSKDTAGGIRSLFSLVLNAGVSSMLAVYLLAPLMITWLLQGIARWSMAGGNVRLAVASRSAQARSDMSSDAVAPLAAGIAGSGVVLTSVFTCAEAIRLSGYTGELNFLDTFVILGLVSFVALLTGGAIIFLSRDSIHREGTAFRLTGMSPRGILSWLLLQSLLLTICAIAIACIPLVISGFAAAVGTRGLLGHMVIKIPWQLLLGSLPTLTGVLFVILWLPNRRAFNNDLGRELRK